MEDWCNIGGLWDWGGFNSCWGRKELKKTLLLARLLASPCGGEVESGWNLLVSLMPEQV